MGHVVVESTTNLTMTEVGDAVEMKDPTGGRGVNGEIGGKLGVEGKNEEEIVKSAV